jgi:hypothetical protein
MDNVTLLKEIKNQITDEFQKNCPKRTKRLKKIKEKDITVEDAPNIICRQFDYKCTGVGKTVDELKKTFSMEKEFRSNSAYFSDGRMEPVEKELKELLGNLFKPSMLGGYDDHQNRKRIVKSDAQRKLTQEYRLSNAELLDSRVDDFECAFLTKRTCKYSPVVIKESTGSNNEVVIGYITTNENGDEKFILESEPSTKTNGCLIAGLGIVFPPLLILYAIYYFRKKKNPF